MILIESWKLVVLERFAKFDGRAGRAEFWWFVLANFLVSVVLQILGNVTNLFSVLGFLYSLAVLLPAIGVAIRRLHDTGKSGWWLLIALTVVGVIVLIVFYATEGTQGPNKYGDGPEPDATASATAAA